MKVIEFTKSDEVVDYLVNVLTPDVYDKIEAYKDALYQTYVAVSEESVEEFEIPDPDSIDFSELTGSYVSEIPTIAEGEQIVLKLKGQEFSILTENTIYWLYDVALEWFYGSFEYNEEIQDYVNTDEGFTVKDAVKFYAEGYLAALNQQ